MRNPDIYPEDVSTESTESIPVGNPTKSPENDPGGVSTESGDSDPGGDPTQSPESNPGGGSTESTESNLGPTEPVQAKVITDLARHVYQVTGLTLVGLAILMM